MDHVANDASCKILRTVSTNNGGEKRKQFEVGIFRSYEEHVKCALNLPHPVESTEGVPDDLKRAAFNVVTKGMYEVARLRNEAMKDCLKMASDLKLEEKALHERMNPSLAKITVNKKILLFERLLPSETLDVLPAPEVHRASSMDGSHLSSSLSEAFQARVLEKWLWTSMDQISADPICTTGNLRGFWAM